MKRKIFIIISFIFITGIARGQNCFSPAIFDLITYQIYMPCIVIAGEYCYLTTFDVQTEDNKVILLLNNAKQNDNISVSKIDKKELLPYYDADNKTLIIPAIEVNSTYYNVKFKMTYIGDNIGFYLTNVMPIDIPQSSICIPDIPDLNGGTNTLNFEKVFSQRVLYNNELVECFEYKGSSDFINYISSFPPPVPVGLAEIKNAFEPCPTGYEIGCYNYDEDNNWYAMYKYTSKISDALFPLICPEEKGYKYIYP